MNPKVQNFISGQQAEIDALKEQIHARELEAARKERELKMLDLGMYDIEDNGVKQYDILGRPLDNKVAWNVTEEEYQAALAAVEEKKRLQEILTPSKENREEIEKEAEYTLESNNSKSSSSAASFLWILSWILWIGGLIAAFVFSNQEYYTGSRTETRFNWGIFFAVCSAYGVLGAFSMCAAELFSSVSAIAASLRSFTLKRK